MKLRVPSFRSGLRRTLYSQLCGLGLLYASCAGQELGQAESGQPEASDAASPGSDDSARSPEEPEPSRAQLLLNHLQALGTHNSYHQETPGISHPEWEYTHLPLDEQLRHQGVRQFELDLWFNPILEDFEVLHIPLIDATSTCSTFRDCIEDLKSWSSSQPRHHPLVVLLELKNGFEESNAEGRFGLIERDLLEVWTAEGLVTPDQVRGQANNLRDALAETGWPTIESLRGRALFVLHEGGDYRERYTYGGHHTRGRLMFPDSQGDASFPYSGVHVVNDPVGSRAKIEALVEAGHLVRTRADAGGDEARANDTSRLEAALASGAHFITTDYPTPRQGLDYVARIPGGNPSRCNPRVAPPECQSREIEDLSELSP